MKFGEGSLSRQAAFFFFLLLALELYPGAGAYHAGFPFLILGWVVLVIASFGKIKSIPFTERWWALAIPFFAGLSLYSPRLKYVDFQRPVRFFMILLGINMALAMIWCLFRIFRTNDEKFHQRRSLVFFSLCISVILAQAFAIYLVPKPWIDVFQNTTIAADAILGGKNPYGIIYPDLYHGEYNYQPGFFYLPAVVYLSGFFRFLFGDYRYGLLVSNIISAFVFYSLGKRKARHLGEDAALLFLLFPLNYFCLSQGWVDSFVLSGLLLFYLWVEEGNWKSMLPFVLVLNSKHYAWLPLLFFTLAGGRDLKRGYWVKALSLGLLVAAPLVFLDIEAFMKNMFHYWEAEIRLDGLSLMAWLHHELSLHPPAWIVLMLGALIVFCCIFRTALWLQRKVVSQESIMQNLLISLSGIFLFGKFASCNYYWFCAACAILVAFHPETAKRSS